MSDCCNQDNQGSEAQAEKEYSDAFKEYAARTDGDESLPSPDGELARFHRTLDTWHAEAEKVLRAEGVDPLEALRGVKVVGLPRARPYFSLNLHRERHPELMDPAHRGYYAVRQLAWVELMRELLQELGSDKATTNEVLRHIYCLNLGRALGKAEIGMLYPDIEKAFHGRKQASVAKRKRGPRPKKRMVWWFAEWVEEQGQEVNFANVLKAMANASMEETAISPQNKEILDEVYHSVSREPPPLQVLEIDDRKRAIRVGDLNKPGKDDEYMSFQMIEEYTSEFLEHSRLPR